jgi:hypothetical protein
VKCDQDAFDILYDTYQRRYNNGETSVGNIREKVAILDRDALNSGEETNLVVIYPPPPSP